MTKWVIGQFGRLVLWFMPFVIMSVVFVVAMPWVTQQNPALAQVLRPVGAIVVMGYSLFMVLRVLKWQRRLDEVHLASQGFANSYGWILGGLATVLLFMAPPVMNWLVGLVNAAVSALGTGSPDVTNHAVRLAFFVGISVVMLIQGLAVSVASLVWWRRMGGLGERS
jgi:hypothetical protein